MIFGAAERLLTTSFLGGIEQTPGSETLNPQVPHPTSPMDIGAEILLEVHLAKLSPHYSKAEDLELQNAKRPPPPPPGALGFMMKS